MNAIRVGLIGYGHWGPNYARIFSELHESNITAICELKHEQLQQAMSWHRQAFACRDVREILKRNDVDAMVISTPASSHFELALAALETGRHVLVEKPMALSVEHCEKLCDLAEQKRLILMVGHTFIYNNGVKKVKECMRSSDFGKIYYLTATRTNLGPIRQDVNAIWDLAPHDLSIFNFLLDESPQWVSSIGSRVLGNAREDVGFITLGYSDGVIGNIHVSWIVPNKVREVVVVGDRRRIVFNDLSNIERVRIFEKGIQVSEPITQTYGEFKLSISDGDIISPKIEPSEPLKNQCEDFIEAIATGKRPASDGNIGYQIVRTLVAIDASMRDQGATKEV